MESLEQIGIKAKKASRYLAKLGIDEKNKALEAVADALTANAESIIAANEKDLVNAKANGMKPALIDRLTLDVKRINAMAERREYLLALLQLYMSQDLMLLLMHSDLLSSLAMPAS